MLSLWATETGNRSTCFSPDSKDSVIEYYNDYDAGDLCFGSSSGERIHISDSTVGINFGLKDSSLYYESHKDNIITGGKVRLDLSTLRIGYEGYNGFISNGVSYIDYTYSSTSLIPLIPLGRFNIPVESMNINTLMDTHEVMVQNVR